MRKPDFVIGAPDAPYLRRWWVIPRNRWFNIYLHQFLKSDDDRALHDHMYWNVSIILKGRYREHLPDGFVDRIAPAISGFRRPEQAHRIELNHGPCWTLFITGPRVREWGFIWDHGWRHWTEFCAADPGQVGRGCDD